MKVVIVGGVAGGASAAARIRRLDEHAQIVMIERSGYVSYANCGLPYYVGGVIKEQEELTLQTPESFWDRFRIDVRVRQEVTAINPTEKTVTVHALDSGKVYTETYDKLLLAPGAKPTVPALSGVSSERVFTLRTVEDTLRIRHFVEDQKPKSAVLAGGGFIGLEMAENLTEMGVSVTIVQRPNQLLAPLDADMASFVHAEMRRHGVTLRLGETVTGFRQDGDSVLTLLEESEPLRSDMVLLAIGVTPDTHLAKEAGLELGIRGSIAVNERMETSVPDIYAVGDAVEVTHFVTGQKALISLAGPANKQGRIAADNICGGNSRFARAHIALNKPLHHIRTFNILLYLIYRLLLRACQLIRKLLNQSVYKSIIRKLKLIFVLLLPFILIPHAHDKEKKLIKNKPSSCLHKSVKVIREMYLLHSIIILAKTVSVPYILRQVI